ncbi:hypothetical protein [Embleya sp. NPDC005575]|uniref:hypothetical protein n=1 Tax=Embleya sp. NPDC005575 TaxID=3156892 RepID=UPI0033A86561
MSPEILPTLSLFGKVAWGGFPSGRNPNTERWRLVFLVWRYENAPTNVTDIFRRTIAAIDDLELAWSFTTSWGRNWTLAPTVALELAKEVSRVEASRILQEQNQDLCEKSNRDITRIMTTLQELKES